MNTELFEKSGKRMARSSAKSTAMLTMHLRRVGLIMVASNSKPAAKGKGKEVDARRVFTEFDSYTHRILDSRDYAGWLATLSEKVFETIKGEVMETFFVFNGANPDFEKSGKKMLEAAELLMKDATDCILMLPTGTMIGLRTPDEKKLEDKIWQLLAGKKPKLLLDALVNSMSIPLEPAKRFQALLVEDAFSADQQVAKEVEVLIKQCTTLLVPSPDSKPSWGNRPEGMTQEGFEAIQRSQMRKWYEKQVKAEDKFVKALGALLKLKPEYEGFLSHVQKTHAPETAAEEPELTIEERKEIYAHVLSQLTAAGTLKPEELKSYFRTSLDPRDQVATMFDWRDFPAELTKAVKAYYEEEGISMPPEQGKVKTPPTA